METTTFVEEFGTESLVRAHFWDEVIKAGYRCTGSVEITDGQKEYTLETLVKEAELNILACSYNTTLEEAEDGSESFVTKLWNMSITLADSTRMLIYRSSGGRNWTFAWTCLGTKQTPLCRETVDLIISLIPRVEKADDKLYMQFWMMGGQGPVHYDKTVESEDWDGIRGNYDTKIQPSLDTLMSMESADIEAGKLILWHGPPGTGKTHAIRALCSKWKEWATSMYITDPETFFGRPDYMTRTVFESPGYKASLLILEDADEFISADAKNRTGQGMSRLLNLADGLIGQGLNLLILITTNEKIGNLHPAMQRPGRCLATLNFETLSYEQSKDWLAAKGFTGSIEAKSHSLAELYDQINRNLIKPEEALVSTGQYL